MNKQELLSAFEMMPDWDDRFRMIEDLGRQMPTLPEEALTEENRVKDCNTQAWLIAHLDDQEPPRLVLEADAETSMVRGLMALMLLPFRDKTPEEVLNTDPYELLGEVGMDEALSPTRRAGMEALMLRVKELALEHARTNA
ncbi:MULTISPECIES: SufE family protein [unclassified Thioalkalivibrio]|uniref:SufE family protein n=1 Tax=unclassified Thioalkalivibrio TaxID=2621013 RepID=UPI0003625E37|nr:MULTISPECIES: SufE family protein [unclassified Thioalkalivibrio]PYG04512.1 cysteine desulfuration protein SufE [Thioalkalivibrio sp. ALE21]